MPYYIYKRITMNTKYYLCYITSFFFVFFSCQNYNEDYSEDSLHISNENNIVKTNIYSFDIDTQNFTIELSLYEGIYEKLNVSQKTYSYTGNLPENWKTQYIGKFLKNDKDNTIMKKITKRISSSHIQNKDLVEKITAFVQGGIRYDYEKLEAMDFGNSSKKFPYETLFEKAGICEDKSILLAKLLIHNNYNVCFFIYPKANHMALGIKVPEGFGNYGIDYCFIESTGYSEIGNIPEKMAGNIVLDKDPEIITINPDINDSKVYHGIVK
ncbi:MAG TPA: hypothetical protein EYQ86_06485, partial [Bacteroidetes bacterium]|nr:hypothetical protein [Bacteroidota bacterium]